jgi:hypothetical protein
LTPTLPENRAFFYGFGPQSWQFRQNWQQSNAPTAAHLAASHYCFIIFQCVTVNFRILCKIPRMPRSDPIRATIESEKGYIQSVVGPEQRPSSTDAQR